MRIGATFSVAPLPAASGLIFYTIELLSIAACKCWSTAAGVDCRTPAHYRWKCQNVTVISCASFTTSTGQVPTAFRTTLSDSVQKQRMLSGHIATPAGKEGCRSSRRSLCVLHECHARTEVGLVRTWTSCMLAVLPTPRLSVRRATSSTATISHC